jgi:diguanylate cyclase (GGDEF)-like protein/PAS domain S-box-containing protein
MGWGMNEHLEPHREDALILRALLETLPDAVAFKDRDGRFTRLNRTMVQWLGLADHAAAIGRTDADFLPAEAVAEIVRREQEVLRSGQPLAESEEFAHWPDGRARWTGATRLPLRDPAGRVAGVFVLLRDLTGHRRAEQDLRDSEALYHSLVDTLPQNVFRKDLDGRTTFVSRKYCETLKMRPEEVLGKTDFDFFPADLARKYREDDARVVKTGRLFETVEEHVPPGGERIFVRVIKAPVRDARGYVVGVQGIFWDVTDLTQAQENLRRSEERYALAVEGAHDGLWDWDLLRNRIYLAPRWKAMLGYEDAELGTDPDEWLSRIHPDDVGRVREEIAAHTAGRSFHLECEYRIQHKEGFWCWMLARGLAVRSPSGKATRMAGSQTDISERKRAEDQLVRQAFTDALTELPNRALFVDRLAQAIRRASRKPELLFGVMLLDIDRFKDVNDSLGHQNGDLLLSAIARRLENCVRPGDTVARLGGDEFAVLLEDMQDPEDAVIVARRIQLNLALPFVLEGQEVFTSASIGIAPGRGYERTEDLMRDADTAMYRAKERGRNGYEVFDQDMHRKAVARLQMETDLRRAVEREEFRVFYQPIIALKNNQLAGFEALVRWQHPARGLLAPGEFLPLAEETGLILPIDLLVLREACKQTRLWQEKYPADSPLRINVNLSSKQFGRPDLLDELMQALGDSGLDAKSLTLEITEGVLMEDSAAIRAVLERIHALKIKLYLDDFGTGYSSLGYLHRFPMIDSLKIHHSFVGGLGSEGERGQLVRTITTLAGNLNLGVVAEGVETPEQLRHLREMRCDRVQGYYFSKPIAGPAAELLVARGAAWEAA